MFESVKKWFGKKKEESEVVSIVVLLSSPRTLVASTIKSLVLPIDPSANLIDENSGFFRGKINGFEIRVGGRAFPYEPIKAAEYENKELRIACHEHVAFLCVDVTQAPESLERKDGRPILARLAAAFTDDTTLAFFDYTTHDFCLPDPRIIELLRSGEVDKAFEIGHSTLVPVQATDDLMNQAMSEARRQWPTFVGAFSTRTRNDRFGVKARFEDGEFVEHMWIEPISCSEQSVTGRLVSHPVNIANVGHGDTVTVDLASVSDWIHRSPTMAHGDFTGSVLRANK